MSRKINLVRGTVRHAEVGKGKRAYERRLSCLVFIRGIVVTCLMQTLKLLMILCAMKKKSKLDQQAHN